MAIDTTRQMLIHLHSGDVKAPVGVLNLGEIAVMHNSTENATLYVETNVENPSEETLAKFISEKAIDAKIKVVSDKADANAEAIAAEKERAEDIEGKLNTRLEAAEAQLGLGGEGAVSLTEKVADLEEAVGVPASEGVEASGLYKAVADVEAKHTSELASAVGTLNASIKATDDIAKANQTAISNMDTAYKAADTKIREDFAAADNTVRGEFAAADAQIEKDYKAADQALQSQIDSLENGVKAATTVVAEGTDAGNNLEVAVSTEADGHKKYTINLTDVASAQGLLDEVSARTTSYNELNQAIAAEKERAEAAESALTQSIGAEKGRIDTLVGSDANKSVRKIANEELAAQLLPKNAQESLDTLQEIAAWIQQHPADASKMNEAIEANTSAIEALNKEVGDPASGEGDSASAATGIYAIIDGNKKAADESLASLDGKITTNANAISANASAITAANEAAAALTGRVTTAEGEIDTLQTTVGDANSGLVKDVATLQTTVGDVNSGLVKDVAALQTTVGDVNSGLVKKTNDNAEAIAALGNKAVVGIAEGKASGVAIEEGNLLNFNTLTIDCGTY